MTRAISRRQMIAATAAATTGATMVTAGAAAADPLPALWLEWCEARAASDAAEAKVAAIIAGLEAQGVEERTCVSFMLPGCERDRIAYTADEIRQTFRGRFRYYVPPPLERVAGAHDRIRDEALRAFEEARECLISRLAIKQTIHDTHRSEAGLPDARDEAAQANDRYAAAEYAIRDTPATSISGIVVHLRLALHIMGPGAESSDADAEILRRTLAEAEALAKHGVA